MNFKILVQISILLAIATAGCGPKEFLTVEYSSIRDRKLFSQMCDGTRDWAVKLGGVCKNSPRCNEYWGNILVPCPKSCHLNKCTYNKLYIGDSVGEFPNHDFDGLGIIFTEDGTKHIAYYDKGAIKSGPIQVPMMDEEIQTVKDRGWLSYFKDYKYNSDWAIGEGITPFADKWYANKNILDENEMIRDGYWQITSKPILTRRMYEYFSDLQNFEKTFRYQYDGLHMRDKNGEFYIFSPIPRA